MATPDFCAIVERLLHAGLTKPAIASLTGVSRGAVYSWIKGVTPRQGELRTLVLLDLVVQEEFHGAIRDTPLERLRAALAFRTLAHAHPGASSPAGETQLLGLGLSRIASGQPLPEAVARRFPVWIAGAFSRARAPLARPSVVRCLGEMLLRLSQTSALQHAPSWMDRLRSSPGEPFAATIKRVCAEPVATLPGVSLGQSLAILTNPDPVAPASSGSWFRDASVAELDYVFSGDLTALAPVAVRGCDAAPRAALLMEPTPEPCVDPETIESGELAFVLRTHPAPSVWFIDAYHHTEYQYMSALELIRFAQLYHASAQSGSAFPPSIEGDAMTLSFEHDIYVFLQARGSDTSLTLTREDFFLFASHCVLAYPSDLPSLRALQLQLGDF